MLNSQKLIQLFSVRICTTRLRGEWHTDSREHSNMIPSGLTVSFFSLHSSSSSSFETLCYVFLLSEPNFVGSFDIGEYVYFFFREHAVEYINCGKAIYSRVARICKKDRGGKHIINQNWATYLKARLNCSISSEFPFYFNEIQSVYKMPNDNTKFYATFTTNSHGILGSAICTFDIKDINAAFDGKYCTNMEILERKEVKRDRKNE